MLEAKGKRTYLPAFWQCFVVFAKTLATWSVQRKTREGKDGEEGECEVRTYIRTQHGNTIELVECEPEAVISATNSVQKTSLV